MVSRARSNSGGRSRACASASKGLVDVGRDLGRIVAHARAHIVVGHRAGDPLRQRFAAISAVQRLIVLVRHPLALLAVAIHAHLLVNRRTRMLLLLLGVKSPAEKCEVAHHP